MSTAVYGAIVVDLLYRLAAVIDAFRLARDPSVGSSGSRMLSTVGLLGIVLVLVASHVAVARRTDDDRSTAAHLQQCYAAQDESAHDALAELGFRDEQRAKSVRRDHQRLDGTDRMRIDQARPPRKLGQLAHE